MQSPADIEDLVLDLAELQGEVVKAEERRRAANADVGRLEGVCDALRRALVATEQDLDAADRVSDQAVQELAQVYAATDYVAEELS